MRTAKVKLLSPACIPSSPSNSSFLILEGSIEGDRCLKRKEGGSVSGLDFEKWPCAASLRAC